MKTLFFSALIIFICSIGLVLLFSVIWWVTWLLAILTLLDTKRDKDILPKHGKLPERIAWGVVITCIAIFISLIIYSEMFLK